MHVRCRCAYTCSSKYKIRSCVCGAGGFGRTDARSHHVDRVWGAFGKVFPLKVGVAGVIDGVCVAQFRVRAGWVRAPDGITLWGTPAGGRPRERLGDCVLYASDAHRLYRLSPDP